MTWAMMQNSKVNGDVDHNFSKKKKKISLLISLNFYDVLGYQKLCFLDSTSVRVVHCTIQSKNN